MCPDVAAENSAAADEYAESPYDGPLDVVPDDWSRSGWVSRLTIMANACKELRPDCAYWQNKAVKKLTAGC